MPLAAITDWPSMGQMPTPPRSVAKKLQRQHLAYCQNYYQHSKAHCWLPLATVAALQCTLGLIVQAVNQQERHTSLFNTRRWCLERRGHRRGPTGVAALPHGTLLHLRCFPHATWPFPCDNFYLEATWCNLCKECQDPQFKAMAWLGRHYRRPLGHSPKNGTLRSCSEPLKRHPHSIPRLTTSAQLVLPQSGKPP